jgi:predicted negative regulator of RcsB-dependent stress response
MNIILIPSLLLLLLLISIPLSILITWIYVNKKIKIQAQTHGCPFKNACLNYNEKETKEAAKRVAKLILQNMETETSYKKAIRNFIEESQKEIPTPS